MSEEPTVPMQQPQWPKRETGPDEQDTVFSDREAVVPPALPFGDQALRQPPAKSSFEPAAMDASTTPPSFQPPLRPSRPPTPEDQTMVISKQPAPVFAWLVVVDCPSRNAIGTVHTLHPDTTTLGRVRGNGIVLPDETVSAQHARICHEVKEGQDSVFVVFDMGSRNGIFVGDRESYQNDENRVYRHELEDGDYLLLGETTLVFKSV
jgi:hypothetical protein